MKIGKLKIKITADRWPWMVKSRDGILGTPGFKAVKYGWGKTPGWAGRFGGGWQYKFGIAVGDSTVILDLIWGSIRISVSESAT